MGPGPPPWVKGLSGMQRCMWSQAGADWLGGEKSAPGLSDKIIRQESAI